MTREEVAAIFPEATKEQITSFLNQHNSEVVKERVKIKDYEKEIGNIDNLKSVNAELQAKIEEMEAKGLSEYEKLQKDYEKLQKASKDEKDSLSQKIAELERKDMLRERRASAMEKWKITAEQAKEVIKDDGSWDMDLIGQIIADKESASALAKEQEIAGNAGNPSGSGAGAEGDDNISFAEKLVMQRIKSEGTEGTANNNILANYM